MMLRRYARLGPIVVLTALAMLWFYGLLCGMVDANLHGGRMPARFHPAAEFYRAPEILAMNYLPIIGDVIKSGDYFGYDLADGPETTR